MKVKKLEGKIRTWAQGFSYVPVWVPITLKRLRVIKNILWTLDTLRMEKEEFSESRLLSVRRPIQGPHVVKIFQGRNVPLNRAACNKTFFKYFDFCAVIFYTGILISHCYHQMLFTCITHAYECIKLQK